MSLLCNLLSHVEDQGMKPASWDAAAFSLLWVGIYHPGCANYLMLHDLSH